MPNIFFKQVVWVLQFFIIMEWSDIAAAICFLRGQWTLDQFNNLAKNENEVSSKHPQWVGLGEKFLKELKQKNIGWLTPLSPHYPERFQWMVKPPVFLTYKGEITSLKRHGLSVVGNREPSSLGLDFINMELSALLRRIPLTIISGAARGIDQAAHSCALRNHVPTVAVLPAGIANPYPRNFLEWYKPILDGGGCLLSEYAPTQFMQRHFFFRRNQLIVGLSKRLLVIEARRQSGTLMTARHALENHCAVTVVPGSPMDPQYAGSLDLLFDGAQMVRDHVDLFTLISMDNPGHSL